MTAPRLLDLPPSQLLGLRGSRLREAIALSEGRTLVAEVMVDLPPLVDGVTNAELVAAFGADLLLFNRYDVERPAILGLTDGTDSAQMLTPPLPDAPLEAAAQLIGRPVGINLEPSESVPLGRRATPDNARRATGQGARWVLVTGNPGTGVTLEGILRAVAAIRDAVDREHLLVAAGRLHGAGTWRNREPFLTIQQAHRLVEAGADIVAVPAPGTVPGALPERVAEWVAAIHDVGGLAMATVGTSQEGADEATVRTLALQAKAAGCDLHHLGDAGYPGVAVPENLLAYGLAIRGRRHTYRRMAMSLRR